MIGQDSGNARPPEPEITAGKSRFAISLVWIIPIVAAVVALSLTLRHFQNLGPLVIISFETAEGIEAGRTPIKRLNVEVGRVEKIELAEDLDHVRVYARMIKEAENFLNTQTKFWVVRPRIGLSGISGLSTLLSGSYIEMDSTLEGESANTFTGLEEPPVTPEGAPGLRVKLHASDAGSVAAGSPVFYRRLKVGRIESRRLVEDGSYVELNAFIDAPYHTLITTNTRFWNASGIDFTIGADGMEVRTQTLETIIFGGITFTNPPRLAESSPVEDNAVFTLYESEREALTRPAEGHEELYGFVLYFEESVRGLKVGAPVEFLGVPIGHVADINIEYNPLTQRVEVPVLAFIEPDKIAGITGDVEVETAIADAVANKGLRARLQSGSLLLGQLIVEVVVDPEAPPALISEGDGYMIFPTVRSPFGQLAEKATGFLSKINSLPIEELLVSTTRLMKDMDTLVRAPDPATQNKVTKKDKAQLENAPLRRMVDAMTKTISGIDAIANSPEAKKLPKELTYSLARLNNTLDAATQLLEGDSLLSPLYYELSEMLQEVTRAARAVRVLTNSLDEKPNALLFGK